MPGHIGTQGAGRAQDAVPVGLAAGEQPARHEGSREGIAGPDGVPHLDRRGGHSEPATAVEEAGTIATEGDADGGPLVFSGKFARHRLPVGGRGGTPAEPAGLVLVDLEQARPAQPGLQRLELVERRAQIEVTHDPGLGIRIEQPGQRGTILAAAQRQRAENDGLRRRAGDRRRHVDVIPRHRLRQVELGMALCVEGHLGHAGAQCRVAGDQAGAHARARHRRQGLGPQFVGAHRGDEAAGTPELGEVIGDIERRPAEEAAVRQQVPQHLAETENPGRGGHGGISHGRAGAPLPRATGPSSRAPSVSPRRAGAPSCRRTAGRRSPGRTPSPCSGRTWSAARRRSSA